MTGGDDRHPVALIVGGGVGAELVPFVLELLAAVAAPFEWRRVDVPAAGPDSGEHLLDEAVSAIEACGLALKTKLVGAGVERHPDRLQKRWSNPRIGNPNVQLRLRLDLFAGVRPIRSLAGLPTRYPDLDLLLVRENTEDIYKGIEHVIVDGVVQSLKVVTRDACERISRFAFELATEHRRRRLTYVHKGNIMKLSDGLFLETVRGVAEGFPDIELREMIVDAACMQMVLDPYQFDVMLTGNLYGDVLSSLGSGLAGGISNAYSVNVGAHCRVFEAIHGDAPELAGRGIANPLPVLSPALALLRHVGRHDLSQRLLDAVSGVLSEGRSLTPDLGGDADTETMCRAIRERL
ncbi:MAG TPA: isocitrate/isopropylmalate family dehydrogenase [Thermoanaerobaculia bacterium]|nr:isocitrate/isopropylmalate family dehydrogenase [Thermoanaerobaculia bacterium]